MTYKPTRHVFRCDFHDSGESVLVFSTSSTSCNDIVDQFARYMLGAGFLHCNIVEAFQDYVDEYSPALITGSERIETMVGKSE